MGVNGPPRPAALDAEAVSSGTLAVSPIRPRALPSLLAPLMLILAGMAWLALVAYLEDRWLAAQPWANALLAPDYVLEGDDVAPVWVRTATREDPAPGDLPVKALREMAEKEGLTIKFRDAEYVVAVELAPERLARMLASGRLPEPGKTEVLAGDLARETPFTLDGVRFDIVGRLDQAVSGFIFAYVLPYDERFEAHFCEAAGAKRGSLHQEGMLLLEEFFPETGGTEEADGALPGEDDASDQAGNNQSEGADPADQEMPELLGGVMRTKTAYAWAVLLGLLLIAVGGARMYGRIFARLSTRPRPVLGPVLRETVQRSRLLFLLHCVLYGVFFGGMIAAIDAPLLCYRLAEYVGSVFTEGGLSYIGDAYASGHVLRAAWATYFNNYVVQTLGLTYAISIVPLALGVVKTGMSFLLVGFAMAPIWVGSASGYILHSITMILELEAYIFSAFVVVVWPIRLFGAVLSGPLWKDMWANVRIFLGGAVVAGIMLGIAALYEATTLILFH